MDNKSILKERNDLLNEYCIGKMTNNEFFERLDKIQEQREKELIEKALEREFSKVDVTEYHVTQSGQEYYETEVKPKYKL